MQSNPSAKPRRGVIAFAVLSACAMCASIASGQSYDFELKAAQGALQADIALTAPINGTLIGNYDPVTNPGGTQTRPNLFGSGNHPIPFTSTLEGDTGEQGLATQPTGQFAMNVDVVGGQVVVDGLSIDALGGAAPGVEASLTINYQTFYTSNPSDFFPGGFDITLPIGEVTVTALSMTQVGGPAAGTLVPIGADQYTVSVPVDVEVMLAAEFNGEPISPGVIPLTVIVAGTLTLDGADAQFEISVSVSLDENEPGPLESFEDIPMDIPGPISGETVHLLLSGTVQSVMLSLDVEANLVANGETEVPPCTPGDLDCSGTVGVPDLLLLLAAWGNCGDCEDCPADLDGNCAVGVSDLLVLLANWG